MFPMFLFIFALFICPSDMDVEDKAGDVESQWQNIDVRVSISRMTDYTVAKWSKEIL